MKNLLSCLLPCKCIRAKDAVITTNERADKQETKNGDDDRDGIVTSSRSVYFDAIEEEYLEEALVAAKLAQSLYYYSAPESSGGESKSERDSNVFFDAQQSLDINAEGENSSRADQVLDYVKEEEKEEEGSSSGGHSPSSLRKYRRISMDEPATMLRISTPPLVTLSESEIRNREKRQQQQQQQQQQQTPTHDHHHRKKKEDEEEEGDLAMPSSPKQRGGGSKRSNIHGRSVSLGHLRGVRSSFAFRKKLETPKVVVKQKGYPGELTVEELAACLKFRKLLQERDELYRDMVYSFSEVEDEAYALCRFLRARKFDVDAVFRMMDERAEMWKMGKSRDFYPDPDEAVGAPVSVLLTQYPFIYMGNAKNGCPVGYFSAGSVSLEGMECVTTVEKFPNYMWYLIMHKFKEQIAIAEKKNPALARVEGITIMDLKGLSGSQINSRTMDVIKRISKISDCFPELLFCCVILNAPGFFAMTWALVKKFLDPATASKIEIYANHKKGQNRLLELIDEDELASDYGGNATSTSMEIMKQGQTNGAIRQVVELLSIRKRGEGKIEFELTNNERIAVTVYTRSVPGATFSLFEHHSLIKEVEVVNTGKTQGLPFHTEIAASVNGPGKFRIVAKSKSTSSVEHFLIIGDVFEIDI